MPNWNGADLLGPCLDSLLKQVPSPHIIVVDNGSSDDSLEVLACYPSVTVMALPTNIGFAGGINTGIRRAIALGYDYVAAFNSDALADPYWLEHLAHVLDHEPAVGIATCKLLNGDGTRIDSTGDCYTSWGMAYRRGGHEDDLTRYDDLSSREVFGASGAASLYRARMLVEIGLFDEDFFAYFEDVDLSFRAQLAGWKVHYIPESVVYHQSNATSNKITGFAARQYCRNVPLVLLKNVPRRYLGRIGWRCALGYLVFFLWAVREGQGWPATRGLVAGAPLAFQALGKRRRIQRAKAVTDEYIWDILVHDLPPDANFLRKLRAAWRWLRRPRLAASAR